MNYQTELENYIQQHGGRHRLALHSCCAPCSSYVLEYLTKYFDVTVFYYNPNIHPESEYVKRLEEQKRLCGLFSVALIECEYNPDEFFTAVSGLENEPEGGKRCEKCFELRLKNTARLAKAKEFTLLGTTLTVSPHKNAPLINEIGARAAAEQGMIWLPSDFKKKNGYLRSIELCREYGIYRQNYCGCKFSNR